MNDRTKLELSFVAEMFGFVFVVLGALIAERIAARGIIAIVGAAAIWLARNWRDPHYWTVRLPAEAPSLNFSRGYPPLARPLPPPPSIATDKFSNLRDQMVMSATAAAGRPENVEVTNQIEHEKHAYNRAPWMESSKPDASKGTLK